MWGPIGSSGLRFSEMRGGWFGISIDGAELEEIRQLLYYRLRERGGILWLVHVSMDTKVLLIHSFQLSQPYPFRLESQQDR